MKLIATINAEAKHAYVSIDGAAEVRCPIRKETSGHYTITLVGHVQGWPRKYLSIGKELTDMTIEKDSDEYTALSTKSAVRITGPNALSAILERTINQVAASEDITDEEANNVARALTPVIQRLKAAEEDRKTALKIALLDEQIAKLIAQQAALKAQSTPVAADEPAGDSPEFKEARVKARAKKALSKQD